MQEGPAIRELEHLVSVPRGIDVPIPQLRTASAWFPLRGDPRFEAIVNDPKNNRPLF